MRNTQHIASQKFVMLGCVLQSGYHPLLASQVSRPRNFYNPYVLEKYESRLVISALPPYHRSHVTERIRRILALSTTISEIDSAKTNGIDMHGIHKKEEKELWELEKEKYEKKKQEAEILKDRDLMNFLLVDFS